jgi:hypothetical protein
VKTTGILRQGSPPSDRHGEEEGVQALVVKALPEVATGHHDHPFVLLRNRRKALHRLSPLPLTLAATSYSLIGQDDENPILKL